MNFLAHFSLSCGTEERLVGNFLADFLQKREQKTLPDAYQYGIDLHHAIDNFTDQHPVIQQGIKRLRDQHHKYAPVVHDILLDYILADQWEVYFPEESLTRFTLRMYRILEKHLFIMPERLQKWVPEMIADDWLPAYGTLEGLAYTFDRMKRRVSIPEHLDGAVDSLHTFYSEMTEEFGVFYPEIQAHIQSMCA